MLAAGRHPRAKVLFQPGGTRIEIARGKNEVIRDQVGHKVARRGPLGERSGLGLEMQVAVAAADGPVTVTVRPTGIHVDVDQVELPMAHAAFRAGICNGGYGQNECPGWPSVDSTVSGCLQQMWDEGPGDFNGPPPHGHYINLSSTRYTMVACGFYEGSGGVYALQNFE